VTCWADDEDSGWSMTIVSETSFVLREKIEKWEKSSGIKKTNLRLFIRCVPNRMLKNSQPVRYNFVRQLIDEPSFPAVILKYVTFEGAEFDCFSERCAPDWNMLWGRRDIYDGLLIENITGSVC